MANAPVIETMRAAIIAAVRGTPTGERASVTATAITTLYETLHEEWDANRPTKRAGYFTFRGVGDTIRGASVAMPEGMTGFQALKRDDGSTALFAVSARQLREKLADVPAGAYVSITMRRQSYGGQPREYDVVVDGVAK